MTTRSRSSPNVGGAQPHRAVGLVDVPELAQPGDGPLDRARLVQVVLVEVDVEVDPELVQVGLDLGEHEVDAAGAEDLLRLGVRQGARIGLPRGDRVRDHAGGDVVDVGAAVAVLGRRLALAPRASSERANRSICAPWSLK